MTGAQPLVPGLPPDPGRAQGGTEAASDTTGACKPGRRGVMTPSPPQQAPHILRPASQKAEVSHHLPPPRPVMAFPSLPGTEPPLRLAAPHLPARPLLHRSSLDAPGRGEGTGSKHTTQASGCGGGTLCGDRSLVVTSPVSRKLGVGGDGSSEGHLRVRMEGWGKAGPPLYDPKGESGKECCPFPTAEARGWGSDLSLPTGAQSPPLSLQELLSSSLLPAGACFQAGSGHTGTRVFLKTIFIWFASCPSKGPGQLREAWLSTCRYPL